MTKTQIAILLLLVPPLAGCVTEQAPPPRIEKDRVFEAPFDKAWSATVAVFAEHNYPIKAIEKDSGLISSEPLRLPRPGTGAFRQWAVLPSVAFGVWQAANCTVTVFVVSQDSEHTKVQVNSAINAFESNVSGQWHQGYSTGTIECKILDSVQHKLDQG